MIPVGVSAGVSRPMARRSVRRWLRRGAQKPSSLAGLTWASVCALGAIRTPNLLIGSLSAVVSGGGERPILRSVAGARCSAGAIPCDVVAVTSAVTGVLPRSVTPRRATDSLRVRSGRPELEWVPHTRGGVGRTVMIADGRMKTQGPA
jgi:hypothetical protein